MAFADPAMQWKMFTCNYSSLSFRIFSPIASNVASYVDRKITLSSLACRVLICGKSSKVVENKFGRKFAGTHSAVGLLTSFDTLPSPQRK